MESRQRGAVERGRIIGMCEAGYSISDIVRDLGLTRQTVQCWLTRWQESGRPRMTSAEDTARIRAAVERNPFTNSVSVREQLALNGLPGQPKVSRNVGDAVASFTHAYNASSFHRTTLPGLHPGLCETVCPTASELPHQLP
ncbi:hypothetical protein Pcinc_000746 [Petrolisthes cinctipes]|uniref:Uncharacterized protein n=1 Tax=Petrolisthes cinctipes TaxID=88211 RepID=A0AAE1L554_PETCI|nr:hypothetical protein Pcinc_000746 [Petrolisthes cinctipes]